MRIAMFTDSFLPRINGVSVSINSFAVELVNQGHEVFIVCPCYERHKKTFQEKINLENNKFISLYRVSAHLFLLSKEDRLAKFTEWSGLKKYMDSIKPDIIHVHTEFVNGKYGYYYAKHRKIPVIYTFHTYWENYFKNYAEIVPSDITRFVGRQVSMYFLKRANTIIAPTDRFGKVIDSYGVKTNKRVLPTGISSNFNVYDPDVELQIKEKLNSLYSDLESKKILLYVGRVAKEKNLEFLIKVFEQIRKQNENTVLMIVGDGPELNSLKETTNKSLFPKEIIFTGYFKRENLSYIYKMADIFVFPSVTETQGLVTIEAMTMGLPVVAIGEMGTYDVMQGDNGGFMVKNDIEEFSEKTLLLLSDSKLHQQKSFEAITWSKKWSIASTTEELLNIYNDTITNFNK